MLAEDKTMKEIASTLLISINTGKSHLKSIYRKLGTHDRQRLRQVANDLGLVPEKPKDL